LHHYAVSRFSRGPHNALAFPWGNSNIHWSQFFRHDPPLRTGVPVIRTRREMMRLFPGVLAACALLLIGVSGCDSSKKEAVTPAPMPSSFAPQTLGGSNQAPATDPHAQLGSSAAPAGGGLSGKIVETMDAAGYTYVALDQNGKKTWVAMPQTKVKVGQKVTCQPGMTMTNFTSKTLNRTFDSIIFSGGLM